MAAKLGKHDGKEIVGCAIKVTNAGDGLSKAMEVEPEIIRDGTRVFIVLEGVVDGEQYKNVKNSTNKQIRIHTVVAGTATLVDREFAEEVLDKQAAKIEAFRGTPKLDFAAGLEPDGGKVVPFLKDGDGDNAGE